MNVERARETKIEEVTEIKICSRIRESLKAGYVGKN